MNECKKKIFIIQEFPAYIYKILKKATPGNFNAVELTPESETGRSKL